MKNKFILNQLPLNQPLDSNPISVGYIGT